MAAPDHPRKAAAASTRRRRHTRRDTEIRLKRAYDPAAPDDGYRILVDRVWPRGIRRDALEIEDWWAAIAPSDALRRWFGHQVERWPEFRERYRDELDAPERRELLRALADRARQGTVTLVFGARDRERNQAVVIAEALGEEAPNAETDPPSSGASPSAAPSSSGRSGQHGATARQTGRGDASIGPVLAAVERLLVGGIGVTAVALSGAPEAVELTLVQWRVLVVVAGRDGVRIGDLATRLGVAVPSASRLVRRLEERGFVATERDARDRRATLVHETAAGGAVREAVIRLRGELIGEALADAHLDRVDGALDVLVRVGDALSRFA